MRLPNNSDTACLIKADWLEDHGLVAEAQGLREDVTEGTHVSDVGTIGSGSESFVGDVTAVGGIGRYISSVIGRSVGGVGGGIGFYGIGGHGVDGRRIGGRRIGGVNIGGRGVVGGGSMNDVGGGANFDRLLR